jgi:hypothetical protein
MDKCKKRIIGESLRRSRFTRKVVTEYGKGSGDDGRQAENESGNLF